MRAAIKKGNQKRGCSEIYRRFLVGNKINEFWIGTNVLADLVIYLVKFTQSLFFF